MTRLTDDDVRQLLMVESWELGNCVKVPRLAFRSLAEEVLDLRAKLAAAEELLRPRE